MPPRHLLSSGAALGTKAPVSTWPQRLTPAQHYPIERVREASARISPQQREIPRVFSEGHRFRYPYRVDSRGRLGSGSLVLSPWSFPSATGIKGNL